MTTAQTGETFTYYITFSETKLPLPWRWFTRKGFRHCNVWMACEGGTMNVNQSMYGINFYTWAAPTQDVINLAMKEGLFTKVLKVVRKQDLKYTNKCGTIIPTCVSLCQRITGVTFHAFTPYAYYKALLKTGAQEITMDSLMPKKPKIDDSALKEQRKQALDAELEAKTEKGRTEDLRRRQKTGRKSLLGTSGGELGVSE